MELYVHIPFCIRKCRYCDFLSFAAGDEVKEAYKDALVREIRGEQGKDSRGVSSVFFGGGTPSLLPEAWMGEIMQALRESFRIEEDAEISLECNPGTLTQGKLLAYREMGINRLSIGLQSADDRELKLLGRIHSWAMFCESYTLAREAGFSNVNVDLMSALPGQTVESWRETLRKVLALEPEHLSAYSLIIEEGTPFYEAYGEDARRREAGDEPRFLPSEDAERQMYEDTKTLLGEAGYHRYEISNYAREGLECRHNVGYWERVDYLGLGLGASSLSQGRRFHNTNQMERYLQGNFEKEDVQVLTRKEQMEETMFLGLRLTKGVSLEAFRRKFGESCEAVYGPVLEKLTGQGLLKVEDGNVALTDHGVDVSNYCMAEFLL
ncbi:MAG: radical SAM family heme chaperone HemW [Eubacteriales bacterium]|nr:radical SAM family heme chaperone HemW [Eubacteriales bacterium]